MQENAGTSKRRLERQGLADKKAGDCTTLCFTGSAVVPRSSCNHNFPPGVSKEGASKSDGEVRIRHFKPSFV